MGGRRGGEVCGLVESLGIGVQRGFGRDERIVSCTGTVIFGHGHTHISLFPSSPTHTESPISLQYILVNNSLVFFWNIVVLDKVLPSSEILRKT